ncbi:MAG: ankyrin repeat domain-containing protein [Acidobacteriaceae bacterium]|nr:ankyrin repeat domain-containing protein [Acidobacteriaceae bacterium]
MSRELPSQPNLNYLRKEAKSLQRSQVSWKLADAQRQLAHEYGFPSWAKLKSFVLQQQLSPAEALKFAVCDSDTQAVEETLNGYPELRAMVDEPLPGYGFGQHALFAAVQRSDRATIDVLLRSGANINKRTEWWAGGFGVLDDCDPSLADFLIQRGAELDAHSSARLGRIEELRRFIAMDPGVVHARGGDGQTPLHFASSVPVAELLLIAGADMDALDVDHESTPAQYMLRVEQRRHYPIDRQNVARYLIQKGCKTDLLMAAALGDPELVREHLERDPGCVYMSVSNEWFPMSDPRAGGTIYIWKLGRNRTAHTVAREFGHEKIFELLLDRTPQDLKIRLACELGDADTFRRARANKPDFACTLSDEIARKLPDAAQSNNAQAVRLMLEAGWPVDTPGEMGATALHWAAFNGNAEMTADILRCAPALEKKSVEYSGSALSWAVYASGNGWSRDNGDFVTTVRLLLQAGAVVPPHAEDLEPSDSVLELLP